jgi:hypothetical protein
MVAHNISSLLRLKIAVLTGGVGHSIRLLCFTDCLKSAKNPSIFGVRYGEIILNKNFTGSRTKTLVVAEQKKYWW